MQAGHGGNTTEMRQKFCPNLKEVFDFSASVNPLGLPDKVKRIIRDGAPNITNYPDIYSRNLAGKISKNLGISQDNLLITNGSIEAIYLSAGLIENKKSLIVTPTFSEYERAIVSRKGKCLYFKTAAQNSFSLDFNKINKILPKVNALFICNPNNPTGNILPKDELLLLARNCQRHGVLLIIDEAFIDFLFRPQEYSLVKDSVKLDNVIVIGSLTKFFALVGLRVGYITAGKKIISEISKFCFPWAVNSFAQAAAACAIFDYNYIHRTRAFIQKEKDFLFAELGKIKAITPYYPSVNFILCRIKNGRLNSEKLFNLLGKKGIFIRDCSNFRGLNNRYFRVAVKLRNDNLSLISALKDVLNNQ